MKIRRLVLLLTALVMLVSTQALAFDDERKGFMLGLGAGFGSAKWDMDISGDVAGTSIEIGASGSWSGLATDVKIGGGASEKLLVYYTSRQVFFSVESTSWLQGLNGVGVSYFLEPVGPSFYFNGALGLGGVRLLDDGGGSENGVGFLVGGGYEFTSHWSIEANYMQANVFSESASVGGAEVSADWKVSNFTVSVNWLAY